MSISLSDPSIDGVGDCIELERQKPKMEAATLTRRYHLRRSNIFQSRRHWPACSRFPPASDSRVRNDSI